jgi:CRISPR/Cas system-associated protein Cas10 (large subunit of type III CRISPR-Cas system)
MAWVVVEQDLPLEIDAEYGCDFCGEEVPDGAGIYVNDEQDRICSDCNEIYEEEQDA